jgi:asparagine synthase (glutamine-hydrolysing)
MIDVLRHRGPDDTGFFIDQDIGLANARLSIIDIEGGHQPIQNEDATVHVTYNGEIYNFQRLRQELESHGHRFRTRSDTEVIVHGYEEYGEGFVRKLNGMFAIALWDSRLKKLILARDRIGIKPLYYATYMGALLFSSEMKGLLQAPLRRAVDLEGLHAILNVGYIPGAGTLLEGVRKLPPSSLLVFHNGSIRIESYYEIPSIDESVNEDEAVLRLRSVLGEAIGDQLVADVPIGCFLSGGLDTSAVVAYAAKTSTQPLKTFCMGFGEETDEFRDARLIADHFGTEHHELVVDSSQGMKLYPAMIWHMEAPKYNLYPWFVCELVRRHVKACLSGNGGDEIFGGYFARYQNALRVDALSNNPLSSVLRLSGNLLQDLTDDVKTQNRFRVLSSLGDDASAYLVLAGALPDAFNRKLFSHGNSLFNSLKKHYAPLFGKADFLQGLMEAELRTKLVDDLLSVDDSMSMAHSLELRVPLLDNRIVDLMMRIPWRMKYAPGTHGKQILRRALQGVLPESTFRKPKWGFSVNVYQWYKGELGELVRQVLPESDVVRKYFSSKVIEKLLAEQVSERNRRHHVLLWQILGFHFWHKIFVESGRVDRASLGVNALVA